MEFVGGRIGIITPYRSQLYLLRSRFSAAFGSCIMDELEINTVDGFQGREVDILVVSTVRAVGPLSAATKINSRSIGFVADVRRMNVALTRAKHSLWILGNVRTLQADKNWRALVNDAKDRNLVLTVKKPYVSVFNSVYKSDWVSDSSYNIPGQHKSKKKGKGVNKHPEQRKRSNTSFESKIEYPGGNNNDTLSLMGDSYLSKKKAKVRYDSSAKNDKESADDSLNKAFKDPSLATDEDWWSRKGGERSRFDRNIDMDKPLNKIIQQKEGSRSSSQVEEPIDPVSKRKQQREAVDALLPSAFISSKKPESSLKSVPDRRSCPPLRPSGHAIRSTKTRKGVVFFSTLALISVMSFRSFPYQLRSTVDWSSCSQLLMFTWPEERER